jgi:hypothetical protein
MPVQLTTAAGRVDTNVQSDWLDSHNTVLHGYSLAYYNSVIADVLVDESNMSEAEENGVCCCNDDIILLSNIHHVCYR